MRQLTKSLQCLLTASLLCYPTHLLGQSSQRLSGNPSGVMVMAGRNPVDGKLYAISVDENGFLQTGATGTATTDASKLTSGTLDPARLPANTAAVIGAATATDVSTAVGTETTRAKAAELTATNTANAACAKTGCTMTGPQTYNTGANLFQDFTDVGFYPADPLAGNTNRWLSPIGVTQQITLVPKNAAPANKTSVMTATQVTLPNGLGSATQLAFTPSPTIMTWSPTGLGSMQYTQPESALWTVSRNITINSWQIMLPTTAAGCTTPPVLSIQQGGTVLVSITVGNGAAFLSAQGLPLNVTSSADSLGIYVSTAGVGCTTYPSQVYSTVEYQSQ